MKICYFGIYKPELSRNRIYMSGLRKAGVEIVECRDDGSRFAKYWNLWNKHQALKGKYDAMIVGYGGHIIVPFARLITRKPVLADLLGSFADAEEHSHEAGRLRLMRDRIIDWLAVHLADAVLVESEAQKNFFIKRFGQLSKIKSLYTGLDEDVFHCELPSGQPAHGCNDLSNRIVLFRGRLTPESGIFHILKAAESLKEKRPDIIFRIIGYHYRLGDEVKKVIKGKKLTNVQLFYEHLSDEELRKRMCECSIALGQFESNPRLDRTIPHKIFEAMNMGLPVVTGYSPAVAELLEDNRSCLFVNRGDSEDMSHKICQLIDDPIKAAELAANAKKAYDEKCSNKILIPKLISIVKELI